jgi:hypothetical protein
MKLHSTGGALAMLLSATVAVIGLGAQTVSLWPAVPIAESGGTRQSRSRHLTLQSMRSSFERHVNDKKWAELRQESR